MPQFNKLTPNLIVSDVAASVAFYTDVLGFTAGHRVPDAAPFVFASVNAGSVEIFFNAREAAEQEYPSLAGRALGISGTLFIEVKGIEDYYASLDGRVTVLTPLFTQWYGMKEFVIADPDGYILTIAEPAAQPVE